MGERVEELNRAAVRIAKQAADDRCLVAGNLSLTWMYEPNDKAAADRVRKTFDEQLDVQVAEGVDFIIGETFSFLGEALLAVEQAKKTKLPVMVTVCFENEDITTDDKSAADVARALADAGADIVGINCLRSPEHTLPLMAEMRKAVPGYVGCQPVAYRTTHTHRDFTSLAAFPDQLEPYQLTRREMAEYAVKARELGVNYIGACCGAVATHIREMARALGKLPADERVWKKGGEKPMSAYEYYGHDQKAKAGS
jgi:betaine-homocysteine S-methyltransferase